MLRFPVLFPALRRALGAASLLGILCFAQPSVRAQAPAEFPLWPSGAPDAHGTAPEDVPTLTAYLPEAGKANGSAMIICPGGGYVHLAPHEGEGYARWFNANGVTAFVLKYRLGGPNGYHHPTMLNDAARAVRYVRANAAQWKIDPKRIGMIGSSAGGHLTATLVTHFDAGQPDAADPVERVSSRPDLGILCYAVISMGIDAHVGSRTALLGPDPSPELVEQLSAEKQVKNDTPPCFIWHTGEDKTVKVENALAFASALRAHNVPFDLHIYQKGGHGMGLGFKGAYDPAKLHPWTHDCLYWLKAQGFLPEPPPTPTPAPPAAVNTAPASDTNPAPGRTS